MTMPPENLSLADIARLAGVSLATASRALNDAYGVAPATRERVLKIAAEVHYVVSPDASRLAKRTTGRVALVVPHLDRWFFGAMVEGLEDALSNAGLDVLLYHVNGPDERHRFFEELPARRKVDAVVVVGFPVDELEHKRLGLMGVLVVAAGGPNADYPYVSIDDELAGRLAVNHLLGLGHRRIAMIETLDPDPPDWGDRSMRSDAYHSALKGAGVPVDPQLIITTEWGGMQGAEGMARLLRQRKPPTAVYAHSDEVAFGALRTLQQSGLRVPEDVSVVGIDDHPMAELLGLTTVRQPVREQGAVTARMLTSLLAGDDVDRAVMLPTELVVRSSTGPTRSRAKSSRRAAAATES
jgi:DNA-binding LacI/PurR family transcriptional regulator